MGNSIVVGGYFILSLNKRVDEAKPILLKTIDGRNWRRLNFTAKYQYAYEIVAKDEDNAWITNGYFVYQTNDGGHSWESKRLQNEVTQGGIGPVRRIYFVPPNVLWLVGYHGVMRSPDAGESWETIYHVPVKDDPLLKGLQEEKFLLFSGFPIDNDTILVGGGAPKLGGVIVKINRTLDKFESSLMTTVSSQVNSIVCLGIKNIWFGCPFGILYSYNGGLSWVLQRPKRSLFFEIYRFSIGKKPLYTK